MRRIRYAVAMSLDGFIAGPQGEYDWIEGDPAEAEAYFKAFYAEFDTCLMGRRSFELVRGPFQGMRTFVLSRTLAPDAHKDVTILGDEGLTRVAELRGEPGKDIWLFGGGLLFGSLASAGLVDTVEVSIMPVLLGSGIPLMAGADGRVKLKLVRTDAASFAGVIGLVYSVENRRPPL